MDPNSAYSRSDTPDPSPRDSKSDSLIAQNSDLRKTLGKMELVLAEIAESIVWTDQNGALKWCNGSFETLVGRIRLTILGNPFSKVLPLRCEDTCESTHPIDELLAGSEPIQKRCQFLKGEETRELELQGKHSIDHDGVVSTVWVIRDITNRKKLESQLSQAQKLEAVGSMAAGVAHEINTPVHYVGDNLRFIDESFAEIQEVFEQIESGERSSSEIKSKAIEIDLDFLRNEIVSAIAESLKGIDQVSRIVKSVKEFSHPGGRERVPTNPNEVIESAVLLASNETKYVSETKTHLDDRIGEIPCRRGEISQVILNLIVNAAHAIEDSQEGSEDPEMGQIDVYSALAKNYVEIRISDTGPGIPAEIANRIFDPFFTTKQVGKGTGQGLAIANKIVTRDHQGRLFFEANEDGGTTFVIQLPTDEKTSLKADAI